MALSPQPKGSGKTKARVRSGEDVPISSGDDLSVINYINECVRESDDARRSRLAKNRQNMDTYMGVQDFSYKIEGQSTEVLPKLNMAAEQLSAFIKRALTQFGRWFQYKHGKHIKGKIPLEEKHIEAILLHFLGMLPDGFGPETTPFPVRMGDAVKSGALESLMIFKVYGAVHNENKYHVEMGASFELKDRGDGTFEVPENLEQSRIRPELVISEQPRWKLHIDLIKQEDYYPDPSGNGLYEVHEVERDLAYVVEMAEKGVYDKAAVALLQTSMQKKEERKRPPRHVGQDRSNPPSFRKKVVLKEFWGDIIGTNGRLVRRNCVCTIANDVFLIRKPQDNPNWHGERPFVVCPLIRVPHSVWHKALFDAAAQINMTINEVFNLMLDGGLASVWGVKQLRTDWLQDPSQVSNGIPQGKTLFVNSDVPVNGKVLEDVTAGKIPPDAGALLQLLDREFLSAALSNELRAGFFPGRKVLATEIQELSAGQSLTLDSIAGDIEQEGITPVLRKAWLCILQNMSMIDETELEAKIGKRAALWLVETPPEERFSIFAKNGAFECHGLTQIINKARDFQKLAGLMQLCMGNPVLLQAFIARFSGPKIIESAIKMLNLNPDDLEKSEEELAVAGLEMQLALMLGGTKGLQGNTMGGAGSGGTSVASDVNQAGNPLTGMSAA